MNSMEILTQPFYHEQILIVVYFHLLYLATIFQNFSLYLSAEMYFQNPNIIFKRVSRES